MTVPNLAPFQGVINTLNPSVKYSPYTGSWWTSSYIDRIPETSVGWMVAQGWQVVDSYTEEDCGQTFYVMARQSMNNWLILQSLLNEYTQAYNEGRAANAIRYNDIINMWMAGVTKVRHSLDTIGDVSDGHVSLYFTQMDTIETEVKASMDTALAEVVSASTIMDAQLALYVAKLNELAAEYSSHKSVAEAFLVDLGATDLARINEKYDNIKSNLMQGLVNRGLYSSAIFAQIEVQVERERTEEISALNDRLAREKLENEHKLYEQLINVKGFEIDGRGKYNDALMRKTAFLADYRQKIAMAVMQARLEKAQGILGVRDREEKLMAYQLDTHTNLAVGLWGFVERREDTYPSMESITKLVAGLGDSGGGWVTP